MKTNIVNNITKAFIALLFIAIVAVKANASEKVKVINYKNDKVVIAFDNNTSANATLSIEDIAGTVVYYNENNIDNGIYSKVFSLSNLTSGAYKVVVKTVDGDYNCTFDKLGDEISVNTLEEDVEPFFNYNEGVLKMSYLNKSEKEVELMIYDEDQNPIFKKSLGNNYAITSGFNLSSLKEGTYKIEILNENGSYAYSFEK